ncbi:hypothetical protein NIES4103_69720 (plasmid) [Nostoc sp. NIES-4103]|nr:hypothetical protein NIES4103_69720 [Nostoc sp. NIES-4103]
MLKKIGAAIIFSIVFAFNPFNSIVIGENSNSNYRSHLFDKSSKKLIDSSKISIGGIKLGMKEKDIIKKLGKPKSRTIKYRDFCDFDLYTTIWKFDGLEIEGLSTTNNPSKSEVHQITIYSSYYPTEKGVKVGDNIIKALKAYSTLLSTYEYTSTLSTSELLSKIDTENPLVYANDAYGGLFFSVNKQRNIREIRLVAGAC